jgi:hypothetical protein
MSLVSLRFRTAVVYMVLFTAAFFVYSELWKDAPLIVTDSTSYLSLAQDLSNFHLTQLYERALGYPILLLITSSSRSPTRTLFLSLCCYILHQFGYLRAHFILLVLQIRC